MPRFGIGMELLRPVLRITDALSDVGVEVLFTYHVKVNRSWRLGYAFSTDENFLSNYWTIQDTVVRSLTNGWYNRVHQVSVGHQWDLGRGRLRPFLCTDVYVGYQEESSHYSAQYYSLDSLQAGGDLDSPIATERTWRYLEGIRLGLGGAVGLEYGPHRHFCIQIRSSVAYLVTIPFVLENGGPENGTMNRRWDLPNVGSGLYVQFKF